jgi:ATP-dependent RNA helicase DeaD
VRPADIVGAIANEAGVPGRSIGAIDIYDRFSFVDVPAQYIRQVLQRMDGVTIRSRDARIRVATPRDEEAPMRRDRIKQKGKKIYPKSGRKFKKR